MSTQPTRNAFPRDKAFWLCQKLDNVAGATLEQMDVSSYMALQPVAFTGFLSTSAAVANRRPFLNITAGLGFVWVWGIRDPIQAGETRAVFFSESIEEERDNSSQKFVPMASPVIEAPLQLGVGISSADVADTMVSCFLWFRAWREKY